MIEIKKQIGNTQLITETFDFINLGVNFHTLFTAPYTFGTDYTPKLFIPVSVTLKYHSIGIQAQGFYIRNNNTTGSENFLYNILQNGVVADQSGIVTLQQWGVDVTGTNNIDETTTQLNLSTIANYPTAEYTVFKLSITYFLIPLL